MLFTGVEKY